MNPRLQPNARHPNRLPNPLLLIDNKLLRQDMDNFLVSRDCHRPCGIDHPIDIGMGDLFIPNGYNTV